MRGHAWRRWLGFLNPSSFTSSLIVMDPANEMVMREVAIVTGGAKGIGLGIATELARSGRALGPYHQHLVARVAGGNWASKLLRCQGWCDQPDTEPRARMGAREHHRECDSPRNRRHAAVPSIR